MYSYHSITLVVLIWVTVQALPPSNKAPACAYDGVGYAVGESVTSDPCDRCTCTQYGIMCELIMCPPVACVDKVRGACCDECPNGPNCLYVGDRGHALVPEHGCRYSDTDVCYCYQEEGTNVMDTFCLRPLPMDATPACNVTSH